MMAFFHFPETCPFCSRGVRPPEDQIEIAGGCSHRCGLQLQRYAGMRQICSPHWRQAPSCCPAAADILNQYAPPLVIARLPGRFANNGADVLAVGAVRPGVRWPVAVGDSAGGWRSRFIIRLEVRALKQLYAEYDGRTAGQGPPAFFQSNYAAVSLTKRALGFAALQRCSDVPGFRSRRRCCRSCLSASCCGGSGWLIVVLLSMLSVTIALVPAGHQAQAVLVDAREAASNTMRNISPTRSECRSRRAFRARGG